MSENEIEQFRQMIAEALEQKIASQSCQRCGYCPHCGRGGHWTYPYYGTYPYYYPQHNYNWPYTVTCGAGGANVGLGDPTYGSGGGNGGTLT